MINSNNNEFLNLLTEQDIYELHDAFDIFDINCDGNISIDKLNSLLFSLKQYITKEELNNILKEEGLDKSETIDFNQFLKILGNKVNQKIIDEDEYLRNLFDTMDRNKNGVISLHELRYIVLHSNEEISEEDIELFMESVDQDKDGFISYNEFLSIMKK